MRQSLLTAAVLLALYLKAAASSENAEGSALMAPHKIVDVFRFDVFDDTPASEVADRLSESLASAVRSFSGGASPTELQQLAAQHRQLDGRQMRMEDAKRLMDWTGALRHFAEAERQIRSCSELLDSFLSDTEPQAQQQHRGRFLREFARSRSAGRALQAAVMSSADGQAGVLVRAVVDATERHRPKVTSFLLHISRLVLRAAEMEIAFAEMVNSHQEAERLAAEWDASVRSMISAIHEADRDISFSWLTQARQDIERVIVEKQGVDNQQFPREMYNVLASKYPSRRWFVLNYNNVGGYEKHTYAVCGGAAHLRTHGGRNVLVASSDPRTSRFDKGFADRILESVDKSVSRRYAQLYVNAINEIMGEYCADAAARIAVCWGCNVWGVHAGGRLAYRRANPRLQSNGASCRNCHMHTYIFG